MESNRDKPKETQEERFSSYENQLELEARVYTLEKDMQLVTNFMILGLCVSVYFGLRWYQQNVASIHGVSI
jgi:hypothetical protein